MNIRWMIRRDLKYILEIESNSFEFPWTEQDFITQLRQRNSVGMIIENDDYTILGYMIYDLHKTKLDIINFAVSQNHRRQDLGSIRQDLSSQIFVKLIEEVSEYTPKDRFNEIADLAVYAADALINRLKNNDR
jgi:hypothetical protein